MIVKEYTLKNLITIKNGKDYRDIESGSIPVYGTGGVMTYIKDYLYDGESILLPRKGSLDNIGYVNDKFWTVDTMYWSIVNKELAYPKYLYCYLKLLDLSCRDSGSTLPSMTFDSYYTLKINLPNIEIQKRIGDFVFSIVNKIEKNNKIISELEAMAKTIYGYWFLQHEFPNEEGKPYKSSGGKMVWNEELKKEIPEGWNLKKVGEILAKIPNTYKYTSLEYKGDGKFPIIDQSNNFICGYTDKEEDLLKINDCVVFGDHTKFVKYVNFDFARGADGTQILDSFDDRLPNYLLYMQISNMKLVNQGYSRYFKFLKDKYIIIPEKQVSDMYINKVKMGLEKIKKCREENRELSKLRDYLLPLLMNGQVGFKN